MTINLNVPTNELHELKPRLTVVGVGGAGGNAVNNMIRSQLEGMDFVVANTDAQALALADTERRIQLGANLTQGLGAGAKSDVGRAAAEEAMDEILEQLKGTHMAFVAAGMGGGTGTGAAPVIARAARDMGILTVGVVTKPFQFEGSHRMRIAEDGIKELEQYVDTLIIIPNQNLFRVANEKTTFADAFKMADDVLYSGVRGITDLMVMPGLINLDFADVRSVMSEMGKAMMGTGEAEGERRALDAAEAAISNPLLDDTSMKGAKGILINITGGNDMTLFEVDEAANRIRAEAGEEAYIIFGSTFDETLDGTMRVSVVATGIDAEGMVRPKPRLLNLDEDATPAPVEAAPAPAADAAPELAPVIATKAAEEAPVFAERAEAAEAEPALSPESMIVPPTAAPEAPAAQDVAQTDIEDHIQPDADIVASDDGMAEAPTAEAEAPAETAETMGESAPDMTPPTAMPAMDQEDAFIPPSPMERTGEVAPAEAEPFAEADMVNAQKAPAPKKGGGRRLSLFSLATGGGRKSDPKLEPAPAPEVAEMAQKPADSQPELGEMEPVDRLPAGPSEDDLLDIPAFLRRQAN